MSMFVPPAVASFISHAGSILDRLSFSTKSTREVKPNFYAPPSLDLKTLPKASLDKIKLLRSDSRVVIGIGSIKAKANNELVPVYFKVFQRNPNTELVTITAYVLETDQKVGSALIGEEEFKTQGYFRGMEPPELQHYAEGLEDYQGPFLYLNNIENVDQKTYKNVGTSLFFAVMQFYKERYNFHIKCEAVRENPPLWWNFGFVVSEKRDQHLNSIISKVATSGQQFRENYGSVWMTLSPAGRAHWKHLEETRPLCFPNCDYV